MEFVEPDNGARCDLYTKRTEGYSFVTYHIPVTLAFKVTGNWVIPSRFSNFPA